MPMLYEPAADGLGSLVGHVARANRQWADDVDPTVEALAIFTGANAYISPNWYPAKAEHGKVVPTWNYETVHVRGEFVVHDDAEWKRALVTRLTERHESQFAAPWAVDGCATRLHRLDAEGDRRHRGARSPRFRPSASSARTGRPNDIAGTIAGLSAVGGEAARVAESDGRSDAVSTRVLDLSRGRASGASGGGASRPCPACGARRGPTAGASRCSRVRSASGWSRSPRRRRDVQKSVSASSPSVVTAASMRALNRRVDSPSTGGSGEPNTTLVLPGFGRFMPLPKIAPEPSMNIGTTAAPVRDDR